MGTMPVITDKLSISSIVGPRKGQRSLKSFAGKGSSRQVDGLEADMRLVKVSRVSLKNCNNRDYL